MKYLFFALLMFGFMDNTVASVNDCVARSARDIWDSEPNPTVTRTAYIVRSETGFHLCIESTISTERLELFSIDSPQFLSDIVWSNEGMKIAFTVQDGNPVVAYEKVIHIVDLLTLEVARVNPDDVPVAQHIAWSQEDTYIAFTGYKSQTDDYDIFIVNATSLELVVRMGKYEENDMEPSWSSDTDMHFISFPSEDFTKVRLK